EDGPLISFAVNKNLSVGVKIIYMDCCVNRWCWCFVTRGMNTAGQAELVVLLELSPEEAGKDSGLVPPTDMFLHFHTLYCDALKGEGCLKKVCVIDFEACRISQKTLQTRTMNCYLSQKHKGNKLVM
ncbi:Zinc finger fyve domain-containing protein 9, partial [Plakobranchus ocellatus]